MSQRGQRGGSMIAKQELKRTTHNTKRTAHRHDGYLVDLVLLYTT